MSKLFKNKQSERPYKVLNGIKIFLFIRIKGLSNISFKKVAVISVFPQEMVFFREICPLFLAYLKVVNRLFIEHV